TGIGICETPKVLKVRATRTIQFRISLPGPNSWLPWAAALALDVEAIRSDQVEQRIEEDPHQVHEVPVEAGVLDRCVVGGRELLPPAADCHPGQQAHPHDDVEGVKPGGEEVDHVEDRSTRRRDLAE